MASLHVSKELVVACFKTLFHDFTGAYCLHLQGLSWWQYVPPKLWYPPTSPQDLSTEKTNTDIFTAVITSGLQSKVGDSEGLRDIAVLVALGGGGEVLPLGVKTSMKHPDLLFAVNENLSGQSGDRLTVSFKFTISVSPCWLRFKIFVLSAWCNLSVLGRTAFCALQA